MSKARSTKCRSWYWPASSSACSRVSAAPVTRWNCTGASSETVNAQRIATTGSRTQPAVLESGRDSPTGWSRASGRAGVRPRPRKRARSVSKESSPWRPKGTRAWNIHASGSSSERRRRVQRMAFCAGAISVCTNRPLNAWCARSAASGASTTSAYEVNSILRSWREWFVRVTRRISTSFSGETQISVFVSMSSSRRRNSARPCVKTASWSSGLRFTGWWAIDQQTLASTSRT